MPAQTDHPMTTDAAAVLDRIAALLEERSPAAGASQERELSVIERARMHMEAGARR